MVLCSGARSEEMLQQGDIRGIKNQVQRALMFDLQYMAAYKLNIL